MVEGLRVGDIYSRVELIGETGKIMKRLLVVTDLERLERARQAYAEAGMGEGDLPGTRLMTPVEYKKFKKEHSL